MAWVKQDCKNKMTGRCLKNLSKNTLLKSALMFTWTIHCQMSQISLVCRQAEGLWELSNPNLPNPSMSIRFNDMLIYTYVLKAAYMCSEYQHFQQNIYSVNKLLHSMVCSHAVECYEKWKAGYTFATQYDMILMALNHVSLKIDVYIYLSCMSI